MEHHVEIGALDEFPFVNRRGQNVLDTNGMVRARHVDPNYLERMAPADALDAITA